MTASTERYQSGRIRSLEYLGRISPADNKSLPYAVFYVTYESLSSAGSVIAAKLSVPLGDSPKSGWPVSVWCHGFGDPGSDFNRWPLVGNKWRRSRGELATRWAKRGIVTLAPWLPGSGPSEPIGTYSPFSLPRNAQAVSDGFVALRNVQELLRKDDGNGISASFSHQDQILRTDCVSAPLLVYFASQYRNFEVCHGLRAFVADDFQPSIAYSISYLDPFVRRLSALDAARFYCVWWRVLWSFARLQHHPMRRIFGTVAAELFSQPIETSVGPQPYVVGQPFFPLDENELAKDVVAQLDSNVEAAKGAVVAKWAFSPEFYEWSSLANLTEMVRHPFYQELFAASDPFFPETITPFSPGLPLLVIPRTGRQTRYPGMPDFDDRYENMTKPKVETLASWGWDVEVCPKAHRRGTSFGEGMARDWTLSKLLRQD